MYNSQLSQVLPILIVGTVPLLDWVLLQQLLEEHLIDLDIDIV